MPDINDHPDIRRAMRTGYTTNDRHYICPVCGVELDAEDKIYTVTIRGAVKIVGCEDCVEVHTYDTL